MRKKAIVMGLIGVFVLGSTALAAGVKGRRPELLDRTRIYPLEAPNLIEPDSYSHSPGNAVSSIPHYAWEDSFEVMLLDSSKNGYGLVVGATNPVVYKRVGEDEHLFVVYRKCVGLEPEASSGIIGAAYSDNMGESWNIEGNLNISAPGTGAGRYPSGIGSTGFPYAVWNENLGAPDNAGRLLYAWDEGGAWGEMFFTPPYDVNPTYPVPYNLWIGCPELSEVDGEIIINIACNTWVDALPRPKYLFRSSDVDEFGQVTWAFAYTLFEASTFLDDGAGYTSSVWMDINDNGVGYAAVSSYAADTTAAMGIVNHTFFYRKTDDYGANWREVQHIPDGVMNSYFDREFPDFYVEDGDTTWYPGDVKRAFVAYAIEAKMDPNNGLHLLGYVMPGASGGVYPNWPGVGLFHFYTTDGDHWDITRVCDLTPYTTHWSDHTSTCPQLAFDVDNPGELFLAWHDWPDTNSLGELWMDIFVSRSVDNGATWSNPVNVTDTDDVDEMDPHIAEQGANHTAFLIFQIPDYGFPTALPAAQEEDYLNRVYFMKYHFEAAPGDTVTWASLDRPPADTIVAGGTTDSIYGQVYEPDITGDAGTHEGIEAQLGYGADGSTPGEDWTWVAATFNTGHSGDNNDEYMATLTVADAGTYDYCYRYSLNNGPWLYADLDGTNNGYDPAQAGNLVVTGEGIDEAGLDLPKEYALAQNFPNPFNPSTAIRFQLPKSGKVILKVYNLIGEEVADLISGKQFAAGRYGVSFNGEGLASGIYFYKLHANDYTKIKKMILLK